MRREIVANVLVPSRMRVSVVNGNAIDESELRALGVRGVVKPKADSVHLVIGPSADDVARKLSEARGKRRGSVV